MIHPKKLVLPLLAIFLLTACIHDDFDAPPATEIPVGNVITLAELRSMFQGQSITFEEDYSVFATVTMDDKAGNIYRNAFVEDGTAAINLRMQAPGGVYEGDSVRIYLRGTTLGSYQQMLQLDNVNADQNIIKLATQRQVEPTPMGIDQIGSDTQGRLVRLDEVQFINEHIGLPFAYSESLLSANRTLEDCDGNRIIVRTSGYANFADHPVPEGNGTLVAIVAQYAQDLQLYVRRISEVDLEGERCAIPGDDYQLVSIADLRQNYYEGNPNIPDESRLEGVVISDTEHSNHPGQNLFIMDDSGQGMVMRFTGFHEHPMGTHLRIIVSNRQVSEFNGLLQIEDLPPGNAHSLGTMELPEPKERTIAEIIANINTYQSSLVRIQGASITGGNTFAGTLTVSDGTGSIALYTHNWASFANSTVPEGPQTLTAIASFHFSPQLMLRNLGDLQPE